MSRPVIYIAGPIRKGNLLNNVRQADAAMGALIRAGFAPINPMLSVYAGCATDDQNTLAPYGVWAPADPLAKLAGVTADDWLGMDLALVAVSDAVLRLPGESVGADGEVAHAKSKGIPVFENLTDLIAHFTPKVPNENSHQSG